MIDVECSSATAKVVLTIEVDVGGGSWGKECTVGQVHKQAVDGVHNCINGLFAKERNIRIVSDMSVLMITYPIKKGS